MCPADGGLSPFETQNPQTPQSPQTLQSIPTPGRAYLRVYSLPAHQRHHTALSTPTHLQQYTHLLHSSSGRQSLASTHTPASTCTHGRQHEYSTHSLRPVFLKTCLNNSVLTNIADAALCPLKTPLACQHNLTTTAEGVQKDAETNAFAGLLDLLLVPCVDVLMLCPRRAG